MIAPTDEFADDYVVRDPQIANLDTTATMSLHKGNTKRFETKPMGMLHTEGGWPKDVDPTENSDTNRFKKKVEKDEEYKATVKGLGPILEDCIKQNNTIDIYEEYFEGSVVDHSSEPPSAKGMAVFRDPNVVKRQATSINWHPDSSKLVVTYSVLNFQDPRTAGGAMSASSYIWDIFNPNSPEYELVPPSPLCCMQFNPKQPDCLVGGSYNGLMSFYDLRKTRGPASVIKPTETSVIENSHHDPVYDVFWISSKSGLQCASVSTDGQMMWWDTRRLGEPTDKLLLSTGGEKGRVLGGSSMAYNTEAGPTKYLVGTEQGVALSINLRNKKNNGGVSPFDMGAGKHHGPIYSIQRNPIHTKFFMTVGDWTARIWTEDLKTPIMTTKYHPAYLTSGCWSPTRPGVFYVTRMDGVVDVWDYFYRQNEVAYSHKIGDSALCSIAVQGNVRSGGKLVAVGDVDGTVALLEVCDSLAQQQANEKQALSGMFEREARREKNLETRAKEIARRNKQFKDAKRKEEEAKDDPNSQKTEELLRQVDAKFLQMIKDQEEGVEGGDGK